MDKFSMYSPYKKFIYENDTFYIHFMNSVSKFHIFYNDFHFISFIKNLVNLEIIWNFCSLKIYIYIYTEFQHIKLFYIIVYFFFFIFFLQLNFKIVCFY